MYSNWNILVPHTFLRVAICFFTTMIKQYYQSTSQKKKKSLFRIIDPESIPSSGEDVAAGSQSRKQSDHIFDHKYKREGTNWK